MLTVCLIYSPVLALQPNLLLKRVNATTTTKAPAVTQITKPHKGGELLVKFRFGVPDWAKQQIKDTWSKESKELKGKKGVEKLKIKDGASLNQTLMDLQQVNQIVEWVEPNYLLTKTTVQAGPTPNDPQFANQWALENTGATAAYTYSFNSGYSTVTDPLGRIYRTDTSTVGAITTTTAKTYANLAAYNAGTALKTITTEFSRDSGPSYTANQHLSQAVITDGIFTRKPRSATTRPPSPAWPYRKI
jgi:hypothetical protein